MESDATPVDVNRVVSILVGSLVDNFVDPNDPERARFPPLRTSLPTHIARHARILSSSPTLVLAITLTIPTRLSSLLPTSPLPAWI
eukprot:298217-Pleurochrysis_carterae.AAC.1